MARWRHRDSKIGYDPLSGLALEPQGCDRTRDVRIVGSGGLVPLAISPLGPKTCNPFLDDRRGNAEGDRRFSSSPHDAPIPFDYTASI